MKRKMNKKKIALICILLANILFICLKSDTFKAELDMPINLQTEDQETVQSQETIVLGENTLIEQEFVPTEKRLGKIKVYFYNYKPHESNGEVCFSILDKSGEMIYSDSLDASLIKHNAETIFDLSGNTRIINSSALINKKTYNIARGIKVESGERYILQIKAENVTGSSPLEVIMADREAEFDKLLTMDGVEYSGKQIYASTVYYRFTYKVFAALIILLLIAIIMVCLPWRSWDEKIKNKFQTQMTISKLISWLMFLLTPFVCIFINGKILDVRTGNIIRMLLTPKGWLNLLVVGMIGWIVYVVCNRTKYTVVITTLMFGIFAIVNYALVQFRGMPLMATDLANVGTAMDVASSYTLAFDKPSIWVITIVVIWCCVAMAVESNKGVSAKRRILNVIVLGAWILLFNQIFFNSTYLKENRIKVSNFNPKAGYKENGCILGFMVTVTTSRMEKPDAYSVENVEQIMAEYQSDLAETAYITEKTPNIIYIMNESFADLSVIADLELSEDCMPFYRSLQENTIKGNMYVTAFGGQTANTEFEVLTGNTTAFLPYHTVAYSGIIKSDIPSMATSLSDNGYVGNTAFHPGMVDSYNRNRVYPYMGFDKHISIEDVDNPRNIRSFLSDEHNCEVLIKDYEDVRDENSENPYFMFNVTIQNHGGYGSTTGVVNGDITIGNEELATDGLQQFENLMKLSDDALKELVEYYDAKEEPTVIVFFGDHQPSLTDALYKKVYKGTEEYSKFDNYQKRYIVPFLIWANYDIEEQNNVELSTNYLTAYMKQALKINMTGYDKFLMDLYQKVPVITGNCYKGDNGKFYKWDSETVSEYTDLLEEYRLVQYNGLIDTSNIVEKFFYLQ